MKSLLRRVSTRSAVLEKEAEIFREGPLEGSRNVWSNVSASTFVVRGKTYLKDRIKSHSEESTFKLLDVEIFRSTNGQVENYARSELSGVQRAIEDGEERFMVMIVFQTTTIHLVATWAVDPEGLEKSPQMKALWEQYLTAPPAWRNERLKAIPRIVEGGFILRRIVGERPGILGKKLQFRYYQTDKYIEVVCDTVTSAFANKITQACMDSASKLSIDLAFVLEATTTEELPEQIFGCFRMSKPNLQNAQKITVPPLAKA